MYTLVICTNGIVSNPHYNTSCPEFKELLRHDIKSCVENKAVHNRITFNGDVVFEMSEYLQNTVNPIRKRYTKEVEIPECDRWMYDGHATRTVPDLKAAEDRIDHIDSIIIDGLTERIFSEIGKELCA